MCKYTAVETYCHILCRTKPTPSPVQLQPAELLRSDITSWIFTSPFELTW